MSSSAPGKILIAGEYAVLDGGEAVVMAVNRRARAHLGDQPQELSPFLAAAARVVADELGADRADILARVVVDSGELRDDSGAKLGLGSSAAATTAAIALAMPPPGDRKLLHRVAHRAHAAAQGGTGSGADVAASVWGGVLLCRPPDRAGDPLRTAPLSLPADLAAALRPYQAITALWEGGVAAAELGRAAGVEVVTEGHRMLNERAEALGGVAKATGAGGGDVALAAFASPEAAEHFRADARSLGMKVLDLSVDPDGARVEPGAG